jgi:hypothetical protein
LTSGWRRLATPLEIGAGVALAVALVPALTGARGVSLGPWTLPVREFWRPLVIAVLLAAARMLVAWPRAAREKADPPLDAADSLATVVLSCGVAAGLLVWTHLHVRFCGGLDSYGYVSAAQALAAGRVVQPEPTVAWLPFAHAIDAATPLGWIAAPSGRDIVPAYPLGFPMVMALAIAAGGLGAAFYVPLAAGVGIVALSYRLARQVASPLAAAATAMVVAWNPVLINMAVQPMSDVPAAFWYLLGLTLLAGARARPFAAGLAFAMAVWTRPLVLALAPALLVLLPRRREAFARFGAGTVPVFMAMAAMQWLMYGSPLRTGYGGTAGLFTTQNIGRHLGAFARWTIAVHGPVAIAAFAAGIWRAPRRLVSAAVVGLLAGVVPYLFNLQYFDDPDVVRYILPGLVPCVIVAVLGAVSLVQRFLPYRLGVLGVLILVTAAASGTFRFVAGQSTWTLVRQESRYASVGEWFAQRTSAQTLVFADLHSGSLRLYANRTTLRWVRMPAGSIAPTVREARRRGMTCYAVFDDASEARSFERQLAAGHERVQVEPEARVRGVMIHRVLDEPRPDEGAAPSPQ